MSAIHLARATWRTCPDCGERVNAHAFRRCEGCGREACSACVRSTEGWDDEAEDNVQYLCHECCPDADD